MPIVKNRDYELDLCRYDVIVKFSAYDVLTGDELILDEILIDENDITSSVSYQEVGGRYLYEVHTKSIQQCLVELRKRTYFPYRKRFNLEIHSFSDIILIDLGRVGMLNEIREDAFVLTWRS